jgi:hypothetical protein
MGGVKDQLTPHQLESHPRAAARHQLSAKRDMFSPHWFIESILITLTQISQERRP